VVNTGARSGSVLHVEVHRDGGALDALASAWNDLYARAARRSIFLSHDWMCAAWRWRSRSAAPYLVTCTHDSELIGVMPLVVPRRGDSGSARVLEWLAVPDTQWCDVLVAAGREREVARALADALGRRASEWDALRLDRLASDAFSAGALRAAFTAAGHSTGGASGGMNPSIALSANWDAYYSARTRSVKKAVNLAANRLARAGRVDVEWTEPGRCDWRDAERALESAIALSARSWKIDTGNSLDREGPNAFIRELAARAHARDALSIWTLTLDGEALAMEIQLVDDGAVHALRSDFARGAEAISPGSHLNRVMLERLFARGYASYFMGPGENAYKYRWADGGAPVQTVSVYARTLRGRALAAWQLALKPAARRLRDRIRARSHARDEKADAE